MAGKYRPLADWLRQQPPRPIDLSFAEIEAILGFRLPASGRLYVAHWFGTGTSRPGGAIRDAGWSARSVDVRGERLTLEPHTSERKQPRADRALPSQAPVGPHVESVTRPSLPFERLPGGGRQLLGKPTLGDLTSRKGYGPPVFNVLGHRCAYCDADLTKYEAWLGISVDHVLPQQLTKVGWRREWLEDLANCVACCRACNEFTNSYVVADPPPSTPDALFDLRDRHFMLKRAMATGAHERERAWHGAHVAPTASVRDLLSAYRDSLTALKDRGVIRSTKVLADYAEWLAARGLGLQLASAGAEKGFDAVDPTTGETYQVKARQVVPPYNQPDLRGGGRLIPKPFDFLVGVLLDADFGVSLAAKIPYEVVLERAKRIEYTNGYRFHLGQGVLALPTVMIVTEELRAAAKT
jgi:hypothetical protein